MNFMKRTVFITCLLAAALMVAPMTAFAEDAQNLAEDANVATEITSQAPENPDEGDKVNMAMDKAAAEAREAYREATKDLSQEKMDKLASLEAGLQAVIQPSIDVISTMSKLQYCITRDPVMQKNSGKYGDAYRAYYAETKKVQALLEEKHVERAREIDFIDEDVLMNHLAYRGRQMVLEGGNELIQIQKRGEMGEETDCEKLRGTLDEAWNDSSFADKAAEKADDAPAAPEDAPEKTE